MTYITSLQQLKDRAQFFKAGSIIPARIFRCAPRKFQHKLKFAGDSWALPTRHGYLLVIEVKDLEDPAIRVEGSKFPISLNVRGCPYHPKGSRVHVFYGTSEKLEVASLQILVQHTLMNSGCVMRMSA